MFPNPYFRKLCDTIISKQAISYDQLFFLVDMLADYMFEHDSDCYDYFSRPRPPLLERSNYMEGGE